MQARTTSQYLGTVKYRGHGVKVKVTGTKRVLYFECFDLQSSFLTRSDTSNYFISSRFRASIKFWFALDLKATAEARTAEVSAKYRLWDIDFKNFSLALCQCHKNRSRSSKVTVGATPPLDHPSCQIWNVYLHCTPILYLEYGRSYEKSCCVEEKVNWRR